MFLSSGRLQVFWKTVNHRRWPRRAEQVGKLDHWLAAALIPTNVYLLRSDNYILEKGSKKKEGQSVVFFPENLKCWRAFWPFSSHFHYIFLVNFVNMSCGFEEPVDEIFLNQFPRFCKNQISPVPLGTTQRFEISAPNWIGKSRLKRCQKNPTMNLKQIVVLNELY